MHSSFSTLAFLQNIGMMELLIILAIGLLLFGRRLPEVGRSMGKGIVEFKRGLKGIEDDVEEQSSNSPGRSSQQKMTSTPENKLPEGDTRRVSRADSVEVETTKQD